MQNKTAQGTTITIDIGTTNCKVSLFEIECGLLLKHSSFKTPKLQDAYGELFDFESLWQQLLTHIQVLITLSPLPIDSIIIASVGEAGMLLDDTMCPVGPMIAWYDKRGKPYIDALKEQEKDSIYEITGLPAHTNYGISKIKWLMEHYGKKAHSSYLWLTIPDLIAYRFTGCIVSEFSIASRTMCFDLANRCWSNEMLAMFGLEGHVHFPPVYPANHCIATITQDMQNILQTDANIRVYIAGHDHMVGAQAVQLSQGDLLNSTGTTEGILFLKRQLGNSLASKQCSLSNGIYTSPKLYTLFSSMPTGGIAIEWLKQIFQISHEEFEEIMVQLYEQYTIHGNLPSKELIVIPHLNGAGAPYKNGDAKALLYGVTTQTSKKDIVYQCLFGLCLEFMHMVHCFPIHEIQRVIVIGPVANNALWLQLKADVLQKEVIALQMKEAVSYGCIQLVYPHTKISEAYKVYVPDPNKKQFIQEMYERYLLFYEQKKAFETVTATR